MDPSRNDVVHLFQFGVPDKSLQFNQPIVAAHQNDLVDAIRPLESVKRVRNDRLVPEQREQSCRSPFGLLPRRR